MEKEVKITIPPVFTKTRTLKVEANGFVGTSCDAVTKAFEQRLGGGGDNTTREYKPEYYAGEEQKQTHSW